MKQKIYSLKSKIYISCDLWTLLNSLAILRIIAYYINEDSTFQHSTLALKSIVGNHTGDHLVLLIIEVLKDWGFALKLGFFIIDNAGNNDMIIRAISRSNSVQIPFVRSLLIYPLN